MRGIWRAARESEVYCNVYAYIWKFVKSGFQGALVRPGADGQMPLNTVPVCHGLTLNCAWATVYFQRALMSPTGKAASLLWCGLRHVRMLLRRDSDPDPDSDPTHDSDR